MSAEEEVLGELVRHGAADELAAASGGHLGELFEVVMPDGRPRTEFAHAMWELYVAVNMTDVKRQFMSNRRFDRCVGSLGAARFTYTRDTNARMRTVCECTHTHTQARTHTHTHTHTHT